MYGLEKKTVYQYEWDSIQRRLAKLQALEDAGVENWDVYHFALKEWQHKVDLEDSVTSAIDDINDLMTEAEVDEPAGRGAGYAISYDEKQMAQILEKFYERHSKLRML